MTLYERCVSNFPHDAFEPVRELIYNSYEHNTMPDDCTLLDFGELLQVAYNNTKEFSSEQVRKILVSYGIELEKTKSGWKIPEQEK